MRRTTAPAILLTCAVAAGVLASGGAVSADEVVERAEFGDVGIWYATWYSKVDVPQPVWLQGFGAGSDAQFVADVNGDGKADAVTFDGGEWRVALSSGTQFATPSTWITGHGGGSTQQFLGDVTGDGKADAVVYFDSDVDGDGNAGDWYVAPSTGSSFSAYTKWKSGLGSGASTRLLGDVDGDGDLDAVAVYGSAGQWAVSLSNGSSFGSLSVWANGVGTGATEFLLADVNGDGRADAASINNGTWKTAVSSGSAFAAEATYATGHGVGASARLLTDGNGDGYAEPYAYFNADLGLPTADGQPGDLVAREYDRARRQIDGGNSLINSGLGAGANNIFLATTTGDKYGWKDLVGFYGSEARGTWKVQRYRQADSVSWNTWAGFPGKEPIKYKPRTLGVYQQYDSGDSAVIDEHIQMITDAKIDYLLLDETNNLNNVSGAILNRATSVAERLSAWNSGSGNPRLDYAFAIGGIQWSNDPLTIEQEARQVWDEYANNADYGDDYYTLDGKPLLVVYTNKANQAAWHSYTGDKSATGHFTVRFASSDPHATAGEYGWQLPATGTVQDDDVMVAMPGWNNHIPGYTPVSRDAGNYYSTKNWDVILSRSPRPASVVINSFNEFGEDTGVQPTDTSELTGTSEKWVNSSGTLDPDMYWDATVDYVDQYKQGLPSVWANDVVYETGDTTLFKGDVYRASWYSRAQAPGDPNGPWQQIAADGEGTAVWTASRVFTAGDKVTYDGRTWEAKWYSRNQKPGDQYGPWKLASAKYTFNNGAQGWTTKENASRATSVTTFANSPGTCVSGACLEVEGAAVAAATERSVQLILDSPSSMATASSFSLDVNTYGVGDESGFEVTVRIVPTSGAPFTKSFVVQPNTWTPLSFSLKEWAGRASVSRVEVGIRAVGTEFGAWPGRFQLDNVDWK